MPSVWRRTATTPKQSSSPGPPSITIPATSGRTTRWRTSSRWRAGSTRACGSWSNRSHSWSSSFFAVHTWWHQALYHLERAEYDAALSLYDGPIRRLRSLEWVNLIDAASLLWRLSLCGVDVRERSATLAADVAQVIDAPTYIFNDWHAVMAFGLADQVDLEEQLLSENRRHAVGTNRAVAARAGLALLEGFSSFAAGRFNRAIDLLTDVRSCAHAVGGSNAQRDVVDLTLIAAAARAGEHGMARQLVAARVGRRPGTAAAAGRLLAGNAR